MKEKIIAILACTGLLLTSCVNDDYSGRYSEKLVQFTARNIDTRASSSGWDRVNIPLDGSAATSSPSSQSATRGAVVSGTDAPVGSFGVLGYVVPSGTWNSSLTPSFMYNTQVTRQGTSGNYTFQYYPGKYWPTVGTDLVKFFAYYPYNGNGITLSPSTATGYPNITYVPSTTVSDQVDLMYASPSAANNQSSGSAVGLSFSHALTRISFSAECNLSNVIKVQSIALTGIKSKGTLSYDPSVASSPWTLSSSSTDTTTYKVSTSDGTLIPESSQVLNTSDYQNLESYSGSLLLLPQSVTSANSLVVKYTVDGVAKVSTLYLPTATWMMGQNINYQLMLGAYPPNSYVLNPSTTSATTLNIPITLVNQFWGKASYGNDPTYVIGSSDTWTANIIWQDVSGLVSLTASSGTGPNGNIIVSVPANAASGNAVIGIKKTGTNGYAWSWHVWVTDYDPNTANSVINGYTFMNYDLGTTNTTPGLAYKGLYYQWGRKDPFPQTSAAAPNTDTQEAIYGSVTSITNTPVAVTDNLANAVENPTTFYYNNHSPCDWYTTSTSSQNNTLWSTTKTIYDPCPSGWKVMPSAAYSSSFACDMPSGGPMTYSSTNYGWTHIASGTFWSLCGSMQNNSGAYLRFVGTNGYVWSSTYCSTCAYHLHMYNNHVNPTDYDNRAYGYHVRCVRDI